MASKVKIERGMAVRTLADQTPAEDLIESGIRAFRGVRQECQGLGLGPAVKARGARSSYVATKLPFGAKLKLPLHPGDPLGHLTLRTGSVTSWEAHHYIYLVKELSRRVGSNVDAVVRLLEAIERARRQCFTLCEEATRWL